MPGVRLRFGAPFFKEFTLELPKSPERVVRRLYGRGFKILLDLVAAARGEVRVAELPYRMRSRQYGESKLGARVIAEFFMLLLYHMTGRLLPARFFLFGAVGVTGVGVHLAVLTAVFRASGGNFLLSQALATWAGRLADLVGPDADAYVYFNNDPAGCAVRDARVFALAAARAGLRPTRVPAASEVRVG